jgi:hypothetical protein
MRLRKTNSNKKEVSQSVRDPNVNILRASIVVQQIITEFKNAESESRIMAIMKTVLYLMIPNGH